MDGERLFHRALHVVLHRGLAVQCLHREGPARDVEYGHRPEKVGELFRVEGGRGDDEPEIAAARDNLLEDAKEHVRVQRALVSFVHDDAAVRVQVALPQRLPQQHTVGHVLDDGVRSRAVLKTNGIANLGAELAPHLLRHALRDGHRRHAPRLRATDHAERGVSLLVHVLGHLRGLSGASLAHHDHDVVLSDDVHEVLAAAVHGQKLPLLLHGLLLGKLRSSHRLILHVVAKLGTLPEVELAVLVERLVVRVALAVVVARLLALRLGGGGCFVILLLGRARHVAHLGPLHLPEPVPALVLIPLGPHLLHEVGSLARDHGHVAGGVLDRQDHLRLLGAQPSLTL